MKKVILFLFLTCPASAQVLMFGLDTAPSVSAVSFGNMFGVANSGLSATENIVQSPLAYAMTVSYFSVNLSTAPGAGKDYSFAIMDNGNVTVASMTVRDSNTTATVTLSTAIDVNHLVDIKITPSGTPSSTFIRYSLGLNATDGSNNISVFGINTALVAGGTVYMGISPSASQNVEANRQQIVSTPGVFMAMSTVLSAALTVGTTETLMLRSNLTDTNVGVCRITSATPNNACTVSFSTRSTPGMTWTIGYGQSGTANTPRGMVGVAFQADKPGEFPFTVGCSHPAAAVSTTEFYVVQGLNFAGNANENNVHGLSYVPFPYFVLKDFYVRDYSATSPGSYAYTVRINKASPAGSMTCSNAAAGLCSDLVNRISLTSPGDLVDYQAVPTASPAVNGFFSIAMTGYVPPLGNPKGWLINGSETIINGGKVIVQ